MYNFIPPVSLFTTDVVGVRGCKVPRGEMSPPGDPPLGTCYLGSARLLQEAVGLGCCLCSVHVLPWECRAPTGGYSAGTLPVQCATATLGVQGSHKRLQVGMLLVQCATAILGVHGSHRSL